jgi:hypothetical protein
MRDVQISAMQEVKEKRTRDVHLVGSLLDWNGTVKERKKITFLDQSRLQDEPVCCVERDVDVSLSAQSPLSLDRRVGVLAHYAARTCGTMHPEPRL